MEKGPPLMGWIINNAYEIMPQVFNYLNETCKKG